MAGPFTSPITSYVQLPFTTNPDDLEDLAIAFIQSQKPGWSPEEGDLSILMIEALAPLAANAAQIAANMPPAALIALGTELLGLTYEPGVSAFALATLTVQDTNGPYTIPQGSEVDISGIAFSTTADLTIPNGSTTGTVPVAANDPGTFANGLDGTDWASGNLPVFVTGFSLGGATSGGVDPQDDADFLNSVAQELQLRSKSLITLIDFEITAVNTPGIGRAVFVGQTGSPRNIDGYVTDPEGNAVSTGIKDTLLATLSATDVRMVNAVITVNDPAYTTVSVTYELLALPGVDATGLGANCDSALDAELSPAGWGSPTPNAPGLTWVDQPVVHVNRLIGVISGVQGVNYVLSCTISADKIAKLSSDLSTGSPITSLPVTALKNKILDGSTITLTEASHTQDWVLTADANPTDTSIAVTSQTPNWAYTGVSTTIAGPVSGDLTMNDSAAGALPKAGTMTHTIDTPAT